MKTSLLLTASTVLLVLLTGVSAAPAQSSPRSSSDRQYHRTDRAFHAEDARFHAADHFHAADRDLHASDRTYRHEMSH